VTVYYLDPEGKPATVIGQLPQLQWLYRPHRLDGPAVILDDGTEEWWIDGKKLSNTELSLRLLGRV
jgi:hypothetical protein